MNVNKLRNIKIFTTLEIRYRKKISKGNILLEDQKVTTLKKHQSLHRSTMHSNFSIIKKLIHL